MYQLAIIGLGPRGLFALESVFDSLSRKRDHKSPSILIIESQSELGCGSAWSLKQPDENTINISDRALESLPGRDAIHLENHVIPQFPSFIEWTREKYNHSISFEKDTYFNRNVMGKYLNERAHSIIDVLIHAGFLTLITGRATGFKLEGSTSIISFENQNNEDVTALSVLLTNGHLPQNISNQDQGFIKHAQEVAKATYIHDPYATAVYDTYDNISTVAIKGMGLSMIDVVHLCAKKLNGIFIKKTKDIFYSFDYESNVKLELVPFSLDGLPVIPKPVGEIVDQHFEVSEESILKLQNKFELLFKNPDHLLIEDLIEPIVEIISSIYLKLNQTESQDTLIQLITQWLLGNNPSHSLIVKSDLEPVEYMKTFCLMAYGKSDYSLDYSIGQIWRKLQPTLYELLTSSPLSQELQSEFIKVDEFTKRYSYGPPVNRVLQLIALAEAQILNLDFTIDPKIRETLTGWELHNGTKNVKVEAMVNGVLASPDLKTIKDDLVEEMFNTNYLQQFHKELGILTDDYGRVLTDAGSALNISVLGRNAKGSVYGVDAILECFSNKITRWASQYVEDFMSAD
ncbi:MAG: FAD/NAD(P)-binding protein [Nonlabens sp.]|uniref:FAD/NAD(P)-binding protein n=1 Tax=Nonlabens sp. TaxID=1888209 RepID=UPI003EFA653E